MCGYVKTRDIQNSRTSLRQVDHFEPESNKGENNREGSFNIKLIVEASEEWETLVAHHRAKIFMEADIDNRYIFSQNGTQNDVNN